MPSSKGTKKPKSKTGAKKGGVVEFAPLTAAGLLYATGQYAKNTRGGRRIKGGDDVMNVVPGGSVPVISAGKQEMPNRVSPAVEGQARQTGSYIPSDVRSVNPSTAGSDGGSESRSPLVKGELNLTNNPYIGAAAFSRAAPINEPPGLLQQGGAKKAKKAKKDKKRGGAEAILGSAVQSPLVTYQLPLTKNNDYVGGISASRPAPIDAPSTLMGGAKKGKGKGQGKSRKQKGGDDQIAYLPKELMPASTSPATPLPPVPSMASQSCGHIGASIPPGTSSGGKLGLSDVVPGAVGGVSGQEQPSQFGGAKKSRKGKKDKKCGGEFDSVVGDVMDQEYPASVVPSAVGGGKKKVKKDKKKKGGFEDDEIPFEGGETPEDQVANYKGGDGKKKTNKGKKKGGAGDVEPFNPGNATQADALGGFDNLLSDLKKQVGGKYKKKGGAFKLYARELSSLSKKLQKLI